ncbi:MAG: hypothetical protein A2096_06260 [Spirochaetes bacterium GWF1_41_5]|nr:MAG: hypothetical protein A2096_06260 [Spirochaetes bacterium GWF1_41_5]HBE03848.1 hypothetical protein [Spirochaetia bacterium]
MSFFEIAMIAAFGLSWPISIIKSIRSESVAGKSVLFLVIIFLGYVSGVIHKITKSYDPVIILYIINGILVFTDLVIVVYKKRRSIQKLKSAGIYA